jgi:hypothetical protein
VYYIGHTNLDWGQSMVILCFLWSMHYSGYHRKYNAIWSCQSQMCDMARWDMVLNSEVRQMKLEFLCYFCAICYINAGPSVKLIYKTGQRTIKIISVSW